MEQIVIMSLSSLLTAAASGLAVTFGVHVVIERIRRRSLSNVESIREAMADQRRARERKPVKAHAADYLAAQGWEGKFAPVVVGAALADAVVAVGLRIVGLDTGIAAVVAAPATLAAAALGVRTFHQRRRNQFNAQLMYALEMVASELEKNQGLQASIEIIIPSVASPLREELDEAVARAGVSKDLHGSLAEMARKYPSKALDMFLSALDMNTASPTALAPALRQAAAILRENAELSAEGDAETSQARFELWGLLGIVGMITFMMIRSTGDVLGSALFSPAGLTGMGLSGAWLIIGVIRALRMLGSVKGDKQ